MAKAKPQPVPSEEEKVKKAAPKIISPKPFQGKGKVKRG